MVEEVIKVIELVVKYIEREVQEKIASNHPRYKGSHIDKLRKDMKVYKDLRNALLNERYKNTQITEVITYIKKTTPELNMGDFKNYLTRVVEEQEKEIIKRQKHVHWGTALLEHIDE